MNTLRQVESEIPDTSPEVWTCFHCGRLSPICEGLCWKCGTERPMSGRWRRERVWLRNGDAFVVWSLLHDRRSSN